MPEECPLQTFAALEIVVEAKSVVFVEFLQQVEHLGGRLHDGEGWGLGVVDKNGDAACTWGLLIFCPSEKDGEGTCR